MMQPLKLAERHRMLACVGLVAFVASGVYLAPASLLGFSFKKEGVAFRALEGRIWDGRAEGVVAGDIYVEQVRFALDPVALVGGALKFRFRAQGALEGAGSVSFGLFSKRIHVTNANVRIDLSTIRRYSLFGARYEGNLKVDVSRLVWSRKGCERADGKVWTDVLSGALRRLGGDDVVLSGVARCEGSDLLVALTGENSQGAAEVNLLVRPDLIYRITASVTPTDPATRVNLRQFGFEERDQVLTFDAAGEIKGVRS